MSPAVAQYLAILAQLVPDIGVSPPEREATIALAAQADEVWLTLTDDERTDVERALRAEEDDVLPKRIITGTGKGIIVDEVSRARARDEQAKMRARVSCVRAIRGMLRALADALGPDGTLRGMPNLVGSTLPYRAANVRAKHIDVPLPRAPVDGVANPQWGAAALVINLRGELVFARRNALDEINEATVHDEQLIAEDAERVAGALGEVMQLHINAADRSVRKFEAMRRFSERIASALTRKRD